MTNDTADDLHAVYGYYLMLCHSDGRPTNSEDVIDEAYKDGVLEGIRKALITVEDGFPADPPEELTEQYRALAEHHRQAVEMTTDNNGDDAGNAFQ